MKSIFVSIISQKSPKEVDFLCIISQKKSIFVYHFSKEVDFCVSFLKRSRFLCIISQKSLNEVNINFVYHFSKKSK